MASFQSSAIINQSCNVELDQRLFTESWSANNRSTPADYSYGGAPGGTGGCPLVTGIYAQSRDELNSQFPTTSPYPYPALVITNDKRKAQNSNIFKLQTDSQPVVVNRNPACVEPFNIRQLNDATSLQDGYARNIDLDSELRRINHLADKCYYDTYKLHPKEAASGNGLNCHRDTIVKDYTAVGRPECALPYPGAKYQSAITPPQYQNPLPAKGVKDYGWGGSLNHVQYGALTNDEYPTDNLDLRFSACHSRPAKPAKCTPITGRFPSCNEDLDTNTQCIIDYKKDINGIVPAYYKFNGDTTDATWKYTREYPCQRMFNNFTKRSTLPNMLNTFDINPKYL